MKKNLPYILIGAGAAINIMDAFTAKGDPTKGFFYGTGGILKPVNDALPINLGLGLMVAGGIILAIAYFT